MEVASETLVAWRTFDGFGVGKGWKAEEDEMGKLLASSQNEGGVLVVGSKKTRGVKRAPVSRYTPTVSDPVVLSLAS